MCYRSAHPVANKRTSRESKSVQRRFLFMLYLVCNSMFPLTAVGQQVCVQCALRHWAMADARNTVGRLTAVTQSTLLVRALTRALKFDNPGALGGPSSSCHQWLGALDLVQPLAQSRG